MKLNSFNVKFLFVFVLLLLLNCFIFKNPLFSEDPKPAEEVNFSSAYNPLNKIPQYIIPIGKTDCLLEASGNAFFHGFPVFVLIEGTGLIERTKSKIELNANFEKTSGFKISPPNNKFKILIFGIPKPGRPKMMEYNPTLQITDGDDKKLVEYEAIVEQSNDGIKFINPGNHDQNVDLKKYEDRMVFKTHLLFYFKDSRGNITATLKDLKLTFIKKNSYPR